MSTLRGTLATIAGHSNLRILQGSDHSRRIQLLSGAFWIDAAEKDKDRGILVETPTVSIESKSSALNIQTTESETVVRVNQGVAVVRKLLDGSTCDVSAGNQVTIRLGDKQPLQVIPQPNRHRLELRKQHRWIRRAHRKLDVRPSRRSIQNQSRPLLWPLPNQDPIMLYAVSVAAWKSSKHPVVLRSDSILRFRGRTEPPRRSDSASALKKFKVLFLESSNWMWKAICLAPPICLGKYD